MKRLLPILTALMLTALMAACQSEADSPDWRPLLNGDDLSGWTVKFTGEDVGVNHRDTFQMVGEELRIDYSGWDSFDGRFGHIFTDSDYSAYDLRFEYRSYGEQVSGAPDWAYRNNGVLIHTQAPEDMARDQNFPVTLEMQLVNGAGRSNGNICTPGTYVILDGAPNRDHCIGSSHPEMPTEDWIAVRVETEANGEVRFYVEDQLTFKIDQTLFEDGDIHMSGANTSGFTPDQPIRKGRIAFQAESHPTAFRNVEIRKRR